MPIKCNHLNTERKVEMKSVESTGRYLKRHYHQNDLYDMLKVARSVQDKLNPCESKEDITSNTDLETNSGLCLMLDEAVSQRIGWCFYDVVRICQKSWKHRSGNPLFPIKDVKGVSRWEGKNLKSRKRLLKHIIKCLEMTTGAYEK